MIRLAKEEDLPVICEMAREFWGSSQFDEEFDAEHTMEMIRMSYDHGLLVVADTDGVYGFIAGIKSFLLASRKAQMATELAWWVNPKKRGKMTGVRLISFLETLCKQQDVKYLNMAYMETSMPERIKDIYTLLGYKLEESVYTKVLDGSDNNSSSGGSGGNSILS